MTIVYDKKDNIIISSISSNFHIDISDKSLVKRMFPNSSGSVGAVDLGVKISTNIIGGKLEFKDGIPFSIENNGKKIFNISDEEYKFKILERDDAKNKVWSNNFPFKIGKGSVKGFSDMLHRLPHTDEVIRTSIEKGSYFSKEISPVEWWGSFTDAGGYANMNRSVVTRLHNHFIIPKISIYPTIKQIDNESQRILNTYASLKQKSNKHPYVYAFTPMPHPYHPGKKIFYTMMETSTLHDVFVSHCNMYSDEVWVPSKANKELFLENGVKKPIKIAPLGIDESLYVDNIINEDYNVSKFDTIFGQSNLKGVKSFGFLSVIQWNKRKGYDALIKAFVNAFTDKDDVCLVIATQYPKSLIESELRKYVPRENNLPQVLLYNSVIAINEMADFYRCFDCYVHMSRGEGFSLTQIEAAACGLPVISCNHSGMTEYLTEENSYPIYCNETEPCDPSLSSICYFYQGQRLWKVGKRQIDMASDLMRYVVDNYGEAKEKASVFRKDVEEKYTWEASVERIAELLA
jgi:glycosyltransferase involved in cell wall biosynthesis